MGAREGIFRKKGIPYVHIPIYVPMNSAEQPSKTPVTKTVFISFFGPEILSDGIQANQQQCEQNIVFPEQNS
jgi:hypothetical protein